jgi:hypothetical protein
MKTMKWNFSPSLKLMEIQTVIFSDMDDISLYYRFME